MKAFYKISQTWLWQMIFIFPLAVSVLTFGVFPLAIIGMVIDQPEEWPIIPIFFVVCGIGLITMMTEDKMNKQ